MLSLQSQAQKILFEQKARFKSEESSQFEDLKPGDILDLKKSKSWFVISEKGLPFVIVQPSSKNSEIKLSENHLDELMLESVSPEVNRMVSEILIGLRKAEGLMQRQNYVQALNLVTPLKEKYKRISTILFLSGSLHFLLNNKTSSIEDLEAGLKIDPSYEPAQKLLQKLKGGSS